MCPRADRRFRRQVLAIARPARPASLNRHAGRASRRAGLPDRREDRIHGTNIEAS
jgi:hypothetical protein